MRVVVRTIGPFTERLGFKELAVTFNEGTIKDLLEQLSGDLGPHFRQTLFNEQGNIHRYIKLLINGRGIHVLQGLETPLTDGDIIAIFPPVAGGSHQNMVKDQCLVWPIIGGQPVREPVLLLRL